MPPTAVRHVSVSVARDWRDVYAFAADPRNLPRWATGLSAAAPRPLGEHVWEVVTPQGPARVRFAPPNDFGVLDHTVTTAAGVEVYVPMRVVASGPGSAEVTLTLFRQPGVDDAAFEADAAWVARDLARLRDLLEAGA